MTDYEYDPDLPYVVECRGEMDARFRTHEAAEVFIAAEYPAMHAPEIIDTTPKPRVPEDATWITWKAPDGPHRVAQYWDVELKMWSCLNTDLVYSLEDLPGVTPDTVFTVLDERKS